MRQYSGLFADNFLSRAWNITRRRRRRPGDTGTRGRGTVTLERKGQNGVENHQELVTCGML